MTELAVRRPTLADAPAVAAIVAARDVADFGERTPMTAEELAMLWRVTAADLATDAWLVLAGEQPVAYGCVKREGDVAELHDDSCVHPDRLGLGAGSLLVDLAEGWARERGLAALRTSATSGAGRRLLEARGYRHVRTFVRMERGLDEGGRPAEPPLGIVLRDHRPGEDDAAIHDALREAFADHWGMVFEPLEEWLPVRTGRGDYHPGLWRVAEADGAVVGAATCFAYGDLGWILELGIRPEYRGRGLGAALFQDALATLAAYGCSRIGLEADYANETGAIRLYERAGLEVTRRYEWFERPLGTSSGRPAPSRT